MRVRGRKIWPASLRERRVLMALGGVPLRVPRGVSPYMVARRLARAALAEHPDLVFVREAMESRKKPPVEATGLAEALPMRDMESASAPDPVAA